MAIILQVKFDSRQFDKLASRRLLKAVTSATRSGIDQAGRLAKKEASKYVRSKKNLKAKFVRDGMLLTLTRRGAAIGEMRATLNASGLWVPLSTYPHRVLAQGKGVAVRVNKGKKRVVLRSAFKSTAKPGIFLRRPGQGPTLYSSRLSDVMSDKGAVPRVYEAAERRFVSAFNSRLDKAWGRSAG
jgi:hypothetical protein